MLGKDFHHTKTAAVLKLSALILMVVGGAKYAGWGGALFALGLGFLFASVNTKTVINP